MKKVNSLETEYDLIWAQVTPRVFMVDVIKAVSFYTGEPTINLLSQRKTAGLVWIRWAAFYLCRNLSTASYPQIGRAFNKDHTTVMYGCVRMDKIIRAQPEIKAHMEAMAFMAEKMRDERINQYKRAA